MKKLLMPSLLISTLLFSSLSFAKGGISGGGGNVINPTAPSEFQDPRDIRAVIKDSKYLLYRFIKAKYALYRRGSMSNEDMRMYGILFADSETNLHEVMEDIKIDIPVDQGCFDQLGNEFDGSSYNPNNHKICISAFRISKNTIMDEVPIQSAALILHEYAEVVGLTDDEAIDLQIQMIAELKDWY